MDAFRQLVVVRQDPGRAEAEGDHAGAGQCGDVDDQIGFCFGGQDESVGEDKPTLSVRVVHFDGLASADCEDITGAGRRTARHILGNRSERGDLDRQAEPGYGNGGADDCRRTGHVQFHRLHRCAGLD